MPQHTTWGELLKEAVEKPGRMLEAYTAFHNYSSNSSAVCASLSGAPAYTATQLFTFDILP